MDGVIRSTGLPTRLNIKEMDYLSEGKSINVGGEDTSKSYVGAMASLGVYTVLTLACIYYMTQFLDESGPSVQFTTTLDPKASTFRAGTMGTHFYLLIGNPRGRVTVVDASNTYDPTKDKGDVTDPNTNPYSGPPTQSPADGSDGLPPTNYTYYPNHTGYPTNETTNYTDPWSEYNYTDPWSQPNYTDPWNHDNYTTDSDNTTQIKQDHDLEMRLRRLQTSSSNSYLQFSEIGKYFSVNFRQEIIQFGFRGSDDFRIVSTIKKRVIPCSQAEWYNDEANKEFMSSNNFLYSLVGKYGICFDVDDKTQLYGDPLSVKSSRLRLTLDYCDSTTLPGCLDASLTLLRNSLGLDMIIGTFEPSVNLANKSNPWSFDLTSDNRLTLDVLATATVTIPLKNLTVTTDNGILIEDLSSESQAAPREVVSQYAPSFQFGKSMESITTKAGDAPFFTVTYGGRELTYLDLRITSSRHSESYKRSYMTILDLFGNIGGSVEFLIVLFLVMFHWYENVHTQQTVRNEISKKFGVPQKFTNKPNAGCSCCKKKVPQESGESSHKEPENLPFVAAALDKIAESALNLERMAVLDTTSSLILNSLVPQAIIKISPLVSLMDKMIEAKEEEEEEQLKKSKNKKHPKQTEHLPPGQINSGIEMVPITQTASKTEEIVTLAEAYEWINQEGADRGMFNPLVQELKEKMKKFGDKFGIRDLQAYLASSNPERSQPQALQNKSTLMLLNMDGDSSPTNQLRQQAQPDAFLSMENISMKIPLEAQEVESALPKLPLISEGGKLLEQTAVANGSTA